MANAIKDSFSKTKNKRSKQLSQEKNLFRVAIYRRVSTKEQADEGQSLNAQKNKILTYLQFDSTFENKSLSTFDYVDEGESAKDLKRTALLRLLSDINNDLIDYVIVVKLDRLTRSLEDLQSLIALFESKKVKLISINEKLDTQSATGRFFISILGSIAQLEREQISERVHDTFEQLIYDKPLGGATPFGYLYAVVSPSEYTPYTRDNAHIYGFPAIRVFDRSSDDIFPGDYVKFIFDWFHSFGSIAQVAKRLNDLAIPIPRVIQDEVKKYFQRKESGDKVPDYIIISKPGLWSRTTVRDILLNPFYTGVRIWNRFENRTKTERDDTEWIVLDKAHDPLIDEAKYLAVTALYEEIKK